MIAMRGIRVVAAMFVLSGVVRGVELQAQSDSARVAQTVRAYHDYLTAGDSAAALRLLSPDVAIVESGGIEDLEHYRSGHLVADMRFAQAVNRQSSDLRVVVQNDAAWVTSTSTAVGEYNGRAINSTSAELMVLSRVAGEWKIRAIHWSSRRQR